MNEYILKLSSIGIAPHEAYRIWWDFMKNFDQSALDEYIESLRQKYVDRI